ncbi:MAG TPA: thioredoxin domain-containing protein [bacterium]|nr:thioredoxin domain-containing protein [bacterium]
MAPETKKKSDEFPGPTPAGRRALFFVLVLCLFGLAISGELLRVHLSVDKGDVSRDFACRVNQAVDCTAVARSREALFLSVPVPIWALAAYLVFAALAVIGLRARKEPARHAADYLLIGALWSVLYSAYLAYVSAFVLKTFCALCAGLYAANIGLLLAGLTAAAPLGGFMERRGRDLKWLVQQPLRLGLAGFVLVLTITGLSVLYARSSRTIYGPPEYIQFDISDDPMIGFYRAPVTIIEFSDFECPACRHMHETVAQLLEKYDGRIRLIHKNYPLDSSCNPGVPGKMHPYACGAAAAGVCAYRMGEYERYSERLWKAEDLSLPSLLIMAKEEGMDPKAFQQCMKSDATRQKILEDINAGDSIKLQGTPTFIVNGYKFTGYLDLSPSSRIIDRFLKGEPIPPAGIPMEDD